MEETSEVTVSDLVRRMDAMDDWQERNPLRVWRRTALKEEISMRAVAPLLNTSFNSVQDWEQGQYQPSPESMAKIGKLTEMPDIAERWAAWWAEKPR